MISSSWRQFREPVKDAACYCVECCICVGNYFIQIIQFLILFLMDLVFQFSTRVPEKFKIEVKIVFDAISDKLSCLSLDGLEFGIQILHVYYIHYINYIHYIYPKCYFAFVCVCVVTKMKLLVTVTQLKKEEYVIKFHRTW